jgi:hypothetical protein
MNFEGVKKTFREIMSEPGPTGTLSWGRVASSLLVLAVIGWVSRILYLTHVMPPLKELTELMLAPYGSGKIAAAVQAFSSNPVNK